MTLWVFDDTRGEGLCRSCSAAITWFEIAASGKRHPFNAGAVYLRTRHDDAHRLLGELDTKDSHFVACPHAKDWRKR